MQSMTGLVRVKPSIHSNRANAFSVESAPEADRIKVAIAHSDPIARVGLQFACGGYPDFEVCDLTSCCASVVVADYPNAVTLGARSAGSVGRSARIVVVGGSEREWDIRRALERGVRGYLVAGSTPDELAAAVRAAHQGGRHISPQAARRLAESIGSEPLTPREEDVLRLVVHGLPNKSIAGRLGIADGTVKSHLKSAFGKLSVRSRTQAVALIERRGLLEI